MLTQAASCRSTSVCAMLRASSSELQVVSTSLLSVILGKLGIETRNRNRESKPGIQTESRISLEAYEAADGNANQVWHFWMAGRDGRRVYVCQCPASRAWHCALRGVAEIEPGESNRWPRSAFSGREFLRYGR